jgi:hypothetical protein
MSYNGDMRKEKTLLIIGIWVAILPFLGFPNTFRKILFVLTGLALMYLAYLFYLEYKARLLKMSNQSKTFVDNIEKAE